MRRVYCAVVAAALALPLTSGAARAEQKLGVEVYPRATLLPARSAEVKGLARVDASCYRTADGADAVKAFYARMAGMTVVGPNVLRRGSTDVVIRLPASDETGAVGPTSFCIMQTLD